MRRDSIKKFLNKKGKKNQTQRKKRKASKPSVLRIGFYELKDDLKEK